MIDAGTHLDSPPPLDAETKGGATGAMDAQRGRGVTPNLSVEVLSAPSDLAAMEGEWRRLEAAAAPANIFLTWEWMAAWRAHIAPRDDLRILLVKSESGDLVGIAPFVLRRQRLWRELVFMGCTVAAPDHLDCIAEDGWQRPVGAAVAKWLSPAARPEWDIVRLDGMRTESALVETLLSSVPRRMTAMWSIECPFVPLAPTWKEFRAGLSGNFRRNLGRRLRKLEREAAGAVRFDTVSGGAELDQAMTQVMELHDSARRANGEASIFDSLVRRRFYGDVARRFAERGWLRIYRLRIDDQPVAAALCFAYGRKVMLYQMGYDLRWGQYGPGYLIGRYLVESAIESGASEVDWLRGAHPYKYEWNAQERTIVKLRLGSSAAGGVVAPMTRWLRAAKHRWRGLLNEH